MKRLGPYHILRPLTCRGKAHMVHARLYGPGGFHTDHALKIFHKPVPSSDPQDLSTDALNFIAEARVMSKLQGPYTRSTLGLQILQNRLVMSLEYIHGWSLHDLLETLHNAKERLPLEHALWIARCALLALDEAHNLHDHRGIPLDVVHRGVSPENILLGVSGRVTLIDFGVSISNYLTRQTRVGVVKGRPTTISPEQAMGIPDLDKRTDIYSLGLVLYEMLTAQQPLAGPLETALERARNLVIPSARTHAPHLPTRVELILAKATQRDRRKRFQDARSFAAACTELLHDTTPSYCGDELGSYLLAVFNHPPESLRTTPTSHPATRTPPPKGQQPKTSRPAPKKTTASPPSTSPTRTTTKRTPKPPQDRRRPRIVKRSPTPPRDPKLPPPIPIQALETYSGAPDTVVAPAPKNPNPPSEHTTK